MRITPVPNGVCCGLCNISMAPYTPERIHFNKRWYHAACLLEHFQRVKHSTSQQPVQPRVHGIFGWARRTFPSLVH